MEIMKCPTTGEWTKKICGSSLKQNTTQQQKEMNY